MRIGWIAVIALGACSRQTPTVPPAILPQHAPGVVLAAEITPYGVQVEGTVLSDQHVDIDGPTDDRYAFRYQVLDGGGDVLYERSTVGPVLVQAFLGYWSDQSGVDILGNLPTLGRFPLIVPLLDNGETLRFQQRNAVGDHEDFGTYDLSRIDEDDLGLSEAVVGFETLHHSGPSANRLDIAIVGDGYTADELADFQRQADKLSGYLLEQEPFASYADYINIHRVDAVSNESGASYDCLPDCGIRDTAFGTIFAIEVVNGLTGSNYSSRALFQAYQWEVARAVSVVPWDHVLVISNTERFGGMAVHVATTTLQGKWKETAVHELGHVIGLLGDEYTGDDCIRSDALGLPDNIADAPEHPPWSHWIEPETKLPTPDKAKWDDAVGAFGPAYNCDDLYRPKRSCRMNHGGDFCEVCAELLVRRIFRYADPVDAVTVSERRPYKIELHGPRDDLEVTWSVDGKEKGTTTSGEGIVVHAGRGKPHRLAIEVREPSAFVREDAGDLLQTLIYDFK